MISTLKKKVVFLIFNIIFLLFIPLETLKNNKKNLIQHNSDTDNSYSRIADDPLDFPGLSHELPHFPNADFSLLYQIENDIITAHDSPFATTITVLILCVEFPNKPSTLDIADIADRFDDLRDYWSEVSKGNLLLNFDFYGWYEAPKNVEYYATSGSGLPDGRLRQLVRDLYMIADPYVDFNNFIFADFEGIERSFIGIIAPGWCQSFGQRFSSDGENREFWSAKWDIDIEKDGTSLNNFFITSEYPNSMGIATHEFGHMLGLPDLYDLSPSGSLGSGIGVWGLMGSGGSLPFSENYIELIEDDMDTWGTSPAHLCAWSKKELGWADLRIVRVAIEEEKIVEALNPSNDNFPTIYQIERELEGSEYFLIEARFQNENSFDYYIPDEGLLIWHVDMDEVQTAPDYYVCSHYMIDLEENEKDQQLEIPPPTPQYPNEPGNRGDINDCWEVGDCFSETSHPNSLWNLDHGCVGQINSDLSITVIEIIDDDKIRIEINLPEPPEPGVGLIETILLTIALIGVSVVFVIKKLNKSLKKQFITGY